MYNSPLKKRQKLTEPTFNHVIGELKSVVDLRQNTGEILAQMYSAETSQLRQRLARMELELSKIETYKIPDTDPVFQGFKSLSKKYEDTVQNMCEHIELLNIMNQKNNCPIAKIIDDI